MNKTVLLGFDEITYRESLSIQEYLQNKLIQRETDFMYLLFVNYSEHIFTQGKNGKKENLLITSKESEKLNIKIFESDRGGDITYHGPGQLVCYPIFDLKKLNLGVKQFVGKIEKLIETFLGELDIAAMSVSKKQGVWVSDKKIASVGFNIKRFITKHGFSLNINNDLSYFQYINPCGYEDLKVTSVFSELGRNIDKEHCRNRLCELMENYFKLTIEEGKINEV